MKDSLSQLKDQKNQSKKVNGFLSFLIKFEQIRSLFDLFSMPFDCYWTFRFLREFWADGIYFVAAIWIRSINLDQKGQLDDD